MLYTVNYTCVVFLSSKRRKYADNIINKHLCNSPSNQYNNERYRLLHYVYKSHLLNEIVFLSQSWHEFLEMDILTELVEEIKISHIGDGNTLWNEYNFVHVLWKPNDYWFY